MRVYSATLKMPSLMKPRAISCIVWKPSTFAAASKSGRKRLFQDGFLERGCDLQHLIDTAATLVAGTATGVATDADHRLDRLCLFLAEADPHKRFRRRLRIFGTAVRAIWPAKPLCHDQ